MGHVIKTQEQALLKLQQEQEKAAEASDAATKAAAVAERKLEELQLQRRLSEAGTSEAAERLAGLREQCEAVSSPRCSDEGHSRINP